MDQAVNFEHVIDNILAREQGYVDNPDDHGGPTNFGITMAVARANGYDGDMQDLPPSLAREIYRKRYIVRPCFDKVWLVSDRIGAELIDTGVNMGPARAAEMLQRWLNGFNSGGSRYADLFVDGAIGSVTLDALGKFLRWRGDEGAQAMVCALNCTQGMRYLDLAEGDASQETFLYGWIRSRVLQSASP